MAHRVGSLCRVGMTNSSWDGVLVIVVSGIEYDEFTSYGSSYRVLIVACRSCQLIKQGTVMPVVTMSPVDTHLEAIV